MKINTGHEARVEGTGAVVIVEVDSHGVQATTATHFGPRAVVRK